MIAYTLDAAPRAAADETRPSAALPDPDVKPPEDTNV
jgi:hypothetical protein